MQWVSRVRPWRLEEETHPWSDPAGSWEDVTTPLTAGRSGGFSGRTRTKVLQPEEADVKTQEKAVKVAPSKDWMKWCMAAFWV